MGGGPRKAYRALLAKGDVAPDPAQEAAIERLQRLSEALRGYKLPGRTLLGGRTRIPPRGLYIHGDVGRGKSMLMDLFFGTVSLKLKRRVHFHAFMLETHGRINAWRKLDARGKARAAAGLGLRGRGSQLDDPMPAVGAQIARQAHLLCFDEFQVTDVADAMILGRLFETLLGLGVVIVATSNRRPDALYENGLNRQLFLPFIALIERDFEVLPLNGPKDYRLERFKGVEVYHYPLGPEADAAMDAAWLKLAGGERGAPMELAVQGRTLRVPRTALGVARFSFHELCAKPLGPADYLLIAETFHTVLIDGIPKLTPDLRNEARRFVILIDALYEARVKLVCSADAPPQGLYPSGDGSFEFARTASRLIEMQSAEYMALGHGT
jgi:cell division protein ZapE